MATLAARPALAGDEPSPLAHGVLADNPLARAFEPFDADFPSVDLWGPNGKRGFDTLKGRTVLMPLWAEWCAPCWSEIPDFARLQAKYGNDKFAIMPVLTGTKKAFTPDSLASVLKLAHADIFEPLIEDKRGGKLMERMARQSSNEIAIPCNLLVGPDGRVMAREIGRIPNPDEKDPAKSYSDTLIHVQNGSVQSLWGQPPGDEFVKAMANGFLS
ncbi:MAG: TlpA disulfide reductase family protein [Rhizomicrobium sp.]